MKYISCPMLRALRHSSPETQLIHLKTGCNNWHILSPLSPSQDTDIHLSLKGIRVHFCDGECSDATSVAFRINDHFSKADKHNQWNLRSNANKQFHLMTITLRYVAVQSTISAHLNTKQQLLCCTCLQRPLLCCQLMHLHQAFYTTITAIICCSI